MPWAPAPPPLLEDEGTNELGKWALQQLEQLAAQLENPNQTQYNVQHGEPAKPREGMVAVADGTDWDPGDGPGQYMYIGGAWVIQRSGPEPNTYGVMSDGTNTAPADQAGDTFKFRTAAPLAVVVGNDNVTHGDNLLISFSYGGLSSVTPALADRLMLEDASNANAAIRTTVQDLYNLINSLTTKSPANFDTDFLPLYDIAGSVAKKVGLSEFQRKTKLLSSTNASGASFTIDIPAGYGNIALCLKGLSHATGSRQMLLEFSDNNGSSYLNTPGMIWSNNGAANSATMNVLTDVNYSNAYEHYGWLYLRDYESTGPKIMQGITHTVAAAFILMHSRLLNNSLPINKLRFSVAADTFDAGVIELWAIG